MVLRGFESGSYSRGGRGEAFGGGREYEGVCAIDGMICLERGVEFLNADASSTGDFDAMFEGSARTIFAHYQHQHPHGVSSHTFDGRWLIQKIGQIFARGTEVQPRDQASQWRSGGCQKGFDVSRESRYPASG